MKAGTKPERRHRFSTVGALLTIAIAGAIGSIAWNFVPRSEPASGAGSANSMGSGASTTPTCPPPDSPAPITSCSFPASFWTDQKGRNRPVRDLTEIESQNILWISSQGQRGAKADFHAGGLRAADLSCVDLSHFELKKADLRGAEITGASLFQANLSGADLSETDLTDADLSRIILDDAKLQSSDLTGAKMVASSLKKADLTGASGASDLTCATLKGAKLHGTDFTGATLVRADLAGADFDGETDLSNADLDGANFEPTNLPGTERSYTTHHLRRLTYTSDPRPLTLLRNGFHGDGYKDQERQITYALQHANAVLEWNACSPWKDAAQSWQGSHYVEVVSNCVEASLNKLVFDLPFQYGMNPNRPLYIVGALWLLCSIVYVVIIKVGEKSAIFLVCQRDYRDGRTILRQARIAPRLRNTDTALRRFREIVRREGAIWRVALFFSLQSALNLGFQELELGRWLKLLTTREYDLKAKGWARTLSGAQSLLSILMLALSIWGLFGQPFSS